MKKLLLIFLALLIGNNIFAQQQEQCVYNLDSNGLEIALDGQADDWEYVPKTEIAQSFQNETPSLHSAYWSSLWDDYGLYVLVQVSDNSWRPSWLSAVGSEHDGVEIYIDVSEPQQDGLGAKDMQGNYQISPNFSELDQGIAKEFVSEQFPEGNGILYADTYDDQGDYIIEYYIPYSAIPTNTNEIIDPWITTVIGFDVTIVDVDSVEVNGNMRNRAVWSNVGDLDESWNNCDQVGLLTIHCWSLKYEESSHKYERKVLNYNINTKELQVNVTTNTIRIYNSTGLLVKQINKHAALINLDYLTNGIYLFKIFDTNNKIHTIKIIKM